MRVGTGFQPLTPLKSAWYTDEWFVGFQRPQEPRDSRSLEELGSGA
jgi:hypothetical protein